MHVYPVMDEGMPSAAAARACGSEEPSGRVTWTWFNNQLEEELPGLLLDHHLKVHPAAVPVGQLNTAVADAVAAAAADALPPPLAELVVASAACMGVTAVRDLALPCQAIGRVALVGEAGCVPRPHGASAVERALQDAAGLAELLRSAKLAVDRALPVWDLQQVQRGVALCKAAAAAGNRLQGTEEC
jgi:2-polyprenyl-6-methoxyphenol hydroxylase-like FAD-dependent oxidoreductase